MSLRASIGHFEIPARDVEGAARFYREAFGWRVEPVDWPGGVYCKIRPGAEGNGGSAGSLADGGIGGGLTTPEILGADRPLLVIHVAGASLAAWLERIVAAGGSVASPPAPVGDFGVYARFRDPEGNLFGLWQGRDDEAGTGTDDSAAANLEAPRGAAV